MRVIFWAVWLVSCSRHFEAKVEAEGRSEAQESRHETETRQEATTRTVTVTTRPDGTRREKRVYRGPVVVERHSEAEAKSTARSKLDTSQETSSKPGGILAFWPLLIAALPIAGGALIWKLKPSWLGAALAALKTLFRKKT